MCSSDLEKFKFGGFADNDRLFNDPDGCDHSLFGEALRKSLFNYMHGIGLEYPVSEWFDFRMPQTTHSPNLIKKAIGYEEPFEKRLGKRLLWLGGVAMSKDIERNKKGKKQYLAKTEINNKTEVIEFETTREINSIILTMLKKSSPDSAEKYSLGDFKNDISPVLNVPFEKFMNSEIMKDLLETGLLMI